MVTRSVPKRYWRTTTNSPPGVTATTFTQSRTSSTSRRMRAPVRGFSTTSQRVRKRSRSSPSSRAKRGQAAGSRGPVGVSIPGGYRWRRRAPGEDPANTARAAASRGVAPTKGSPCVSPRSSSRSLSPAPTPPPPPATEPTPAPPGTGTGGSCTSGGPSRRSRAPTARSCSGSRTTPSTSPASCTRSATGSGCRASRRRWRRR